MPAQGQHRKPRTPRLSRLTRICIAAGTGGAALALPLVAATGASAAPAHAPAQAASAAAAHHTTGAEDHAKHGRHAKPRTYEVVSGDSLSKIARTQHVAGGWHRLYTDNRSVIGADPDLIVPGQHLALNGAAHEKPAAKAKAAAPAAKPAAKAPAAKPAVKAPAKAPAAKPAADTATKAPAPAASTPAASGYTKPVGDAPIGTPYHAAGANWASGYHTGVDFLVQTGTDVHAVGAGTVVSSGWDGSYGNDVIIRHADGKYTLYGHLSQVLVSAGQSVSEGQRIGISGATGNVTGPHLHFEVRTTPDYGSDIDPVAYLASHGVTV